MGPGGANARHGPRDRPRRGLTTTKFRGSITQRLISLSTLRSGGRPPPRRTRFRLLARLDRTGLVTRRVPAEGFKPCFPPSPSFLAQGQIWSVATAWAVLPTDGSGRAFRDVTE